MKKLFLILFTISTLALSACGYKEEDLQAKYNEGYSDGHRDGYEEGYEAGIENGKELGREEFFDEYRYEGDISDLF